MADRYVMNHFKGRDHVLMMMTMVVAVAHTPAGIQHPPAAAMCVCHKEADS